MPVGVSRKVHSMLPVNCYVMVSYLSCPKTIKTLLCKTHLPFPRVSVDWISQEDDFDNVTFYLCNINFFIRTVVSEREVYSLHVPKSIYF